MSVSYSLTLTLLLGISASALSMTPELNHGRAAQTGKASLSLKQSPHQSVAYLLAKKRSAEFVPSDRAYAHMTSFLSKRFPAPTRQDKMDTRPIPRPNIISGIQTQASLTASSSDQLQSRRAPTLSFTPRGSAKDTGHTTATTQKNKISQDDNGFPKADHVGEDIEGSAAELFLQNLIENAIRMLDLSVQSSAPMEYRVPEDSAHQVQIPEHGFEFMKRKAKTEGKRPFDRLASGLIGKRSDSEGRHSNKSPSEPLAKSAIGTGNEVFPADAHLQLQPVITPANDLKRKRGPAGALLMKRPFDSLANGLIGKRSPRAQGPAQ